ncbi:ATP-binding protein [Fluviicola taffensis]|uniref:Putative transcriptional regulator n=1 Tax=Fluviicola taffensis (strain DSM 16823 / NCIMB 13979 / RW262) TaxID=755732 RepID=F2IAD9_FLUTR|nr:ATP-binding protein [Fluviicola taffensis]AEA42074.1 putative transcriptional regulator [Fluviicola taffensis DSM 16823]
MNKLELHALISQGEGFHIEFKESVNSSLAKEFVAFANAKGGIVLVGVDDDGNIKNKALDNTTRSSIQDVARDCDPAIDILIEAIEDESNVLVVRVKEGLNKPYRCTNGFYMREGASSNKRTTHEIYEMFKDAERFSFDDALCVKADFQEWFEPKTLKRFFAEAKKEQILSDEDTLHNLGVLEFIDGKPVLNNAGVLFFTKEPQRFIRQSLIQCVRYKGVIKLDIEDQKDMDSDVITNIDEIFAFLRRSLDVAFKFESGKLTRTEVWEIPHSALKEAIINAIAHRDYINKGTHIQVEVFDDRVSITNFGGLAKGLSRDELGKRSAHRNPNIVDLFHRSNFIEKLGTGLLRIDSELEKAGLPKAEFEINDHWFSIVFKRQSKSGIIEENRSFYDSENLGEKILKYCSEKPRSRAEIFQFIGIANNTANTSRQIIPLINGGLLQMTEPDKPRSRNQMYFTTEIGKNKLMYNIN